MNTEAKEKLTVREILNLISTIISWTVFVLLVICASFLLYYFVATKIFVYFGSKYEPKFSLYTIISGSMTPNINVYDVVVDVRVDDPEDIEIGDVITFYSDSPEISGSTVTHRVISIIKDSSGNYSYQTKGDYNLVEDSVPVTFDKIVGKVVLRIPQLGRVQFFLATSYGWLIVVLIPALYIIVKDIMKIIKLKKEDDDSLNGPNDNKPSKLKDLLKKNLLKQKKTALVETPSEITEPSPPSESVFDNYDEEISFDDLPKLK